MKKSNQNRVLRKELLQKAFADNPFMSKGKKLIIVFLLIWIGIRSVDTAASVVLTLMLGRGIPALIVTLVPFLLMMLTALFIRAGYRLFTAVPILGSLQMMVMLALRYEDIYMALTAGDALYLTVTILTAASAFIQMIFMFILLGNKKSKAYFQAMKSLSRELSQSKKKA